MAEGGYEHLPDNDLPDLAHNDYDPQENADETTPFYPFSFSVPYGQQMEMKTMQEEQSGLPETSFGGIRELETRLAALRRDAETGSLNTTGIDKIPNVENPLSQVEKEN